MIKIVQVQPGSLHEKRNSLLLRILGLSGAETEFIREVKPLDTVEDLDALEGKHLGRRSEADVIVIEGNPSLDLLVEFLFNVVEMDGDYPRLFRALPEPMTDPGWRFQEFTGINRGGPVWEDRAPATTQTSSRKRLDDGTGGWVS